jgi:hypothetical protein
MKERAPAWVYAIHDHFRKDLLSAYKLPKTEIYVDDLDSQAIVSFSSGILKDSAVITMDRSMLTVDHMDTASTLVHEDMHIIVKQKYGTSRPNGDAHGPEWRGLMISVDLTPEDVNGGCRETPVRGGGFWQSYQRLPEVQAALRIVRDEVQNGATIAPQQGRAMAPSSRRWGNLSGAPQGNQPDIPKQAKRIFIYADCSISMCGARFANMKAALNNIWPANGAELFGYSDDNTLYAVGSPDCLPEPGGATVFEQIFLHAELHNPDLVLIYSDGQPSDESQTWAVWHRTSFPIATHFISASSGSVDDPAAQYMQSLCRGGGQFTCGDSVQSIQKGATQAMSNNSNGRFAPRQLKDLTQQIKTGVGAAQNQALVNNRILDLGSQVADAQHDLHTLQGGMAILNTFADIQAQINGQAVQAITHQQGQEAVDRQHRQSAGATLLSGLAALSAKVLGATKAGCEQTLLNGAQRSASSVDISGGAPVGQVNLNQDLLNKLSAVMASVTPNSGLPSPTAAPASHQLAAPMAAPAALQITAQQTPTASEVINPSNQIVSFRRRAVNV